MSEQLAKPGYKTSEFWLAIAAWVVGFLLDSGLIHGVATKGLGLVAASLGTMGYTYARGKIKEVLDAGKTGWKTSEFWLTVLAWGAGAALDSGLIPEVSPAGSGMGMIAGALAQMGYSVARVKAKLPPPQA